ncbi:DMT family transporter [Saccharothrix obliqua]|uniref:DMT family transporter n=1 Tax=Saccharothrix obliqua TaxID=2861747 RepID=UPI001C5CE456|nr:DMT family transporter [Saccharothrix obliqua]MBW4718609.1 DMT family transporter [Saccharothrix obliqua]
MSPTRGSLAAILAVTLWATNAFAAEVALTRMNVLQLLFVQFGSAASALFIGRAAQRRRASGQAPGNTGKALVVGVVGLTGTIFLQYFAFASTPIVAASVISYAWPLLAAVAVMALTRSRQAVPGVVLGVVGFAGVALIVGDQAATSAGGSLLGYAAALGSAACMAFFTVAAGRVRASTVDMLVPATATGAVVAGVLLALGDATWPPLPAVALACYVGLGPMAAGYALWTSAMKNGTDRLALLGFATPLLSTALLVATGAPVTGPLLTGAALVLACGAGVLLDGHRRSRDTAAPGKS